MPIKAKQPVFSPTRSGLIQICGFWRRGVDAYFDVSFANVNAESYKDLDTATIFAKREKSKKREYGELVGLEKKGGST